MSKYIVYCLNTNNNQLDIISIEEDEKVAKNIQNNHSFNLLCELNKSKSLYKLEIKYNTNYRDQYRYKKWMDIEYNNGK
jgi:hypothetical protein